MAYWELVIGSPGNGKSLYMARTVRWLVERNKRNLLKYGIFRKVRPNSKFAKHFEDSCIIEHDGKTYNFLEYWETMHDVMQMRDCDIVWDEIATEMDARESQTLPREVKRFISQYRKRGLEIYSNTQDFSYVDKRARGFVTHLYMLTKIIGSPDPSPTKPPIKRIWGLIAKSKATDDSIRADSPENIKFHPIPSFFTINREDCEMYDTLDDIPASPPLPRLRQSTVEIYKGGSKDGYTKEIYI